MTIEAKITYLDGASKSYTASNSQEEFEVPDGSITIFDYPFAGIHQVDLNGTLEGWNSGYRSEIEVKRFDGDMFLDPIETRILHSGGRLWEKLDQDQALQVKTKDFTLQALRTK